MYQVLFNLDVSSTRYSAETSSQWHVLSIGTIVLGIKDGPFFFWRGVVVRHFPLQTILLN